MEKDASLMHCTKDRLKYYFPVIEINANCLKSQYDARKKI